MTAVQGAQPSPGAEDPGLAGAEAELHGFEALTW